MALRLFAALPVPDEVGERLCALMRGVPGARWRPLENLHVTLRFFGELAEPVAADLDAELARAALPIGPLALQVRGAGHFGGAEPRVLWMGLADNPALARLAAACERAARAAGLPPERDAFVPHVTMAYLQRSDLGRVMGFTQRHALYQSAPWRAEAFGLYSSWTRDAAPSHYRLEAGYPLLGEERA